MVYYIIIYPFWNPKNLNLSNPPIFNTTSTMASATSASASAFDPAKNKIFHDSLDGLATFEPFTAPYRGKQVQFTGRFVVGGDIIYKQAKKEWGCKYCANRLKTMARLVGSVGPWVSTASTPTTQEFNDMGNYTRRHIINNPTSTWELTLFNSEFDQFKTKSVGGFDHYYLSAWVPWSCHSRVAVHSEEETAMINSAFRKYGRLIDAMLNGFEPEDWDGIRTSLDHFESVMKRASYANTLAGCLTWFRAIDAMVIDRGAGHPGEVITYRNLPITEKCASLARRFFRPTSRRKK